MRKQGIKKGMSVLSAFIIGFTTVAGLMGSGITSKAATTNISNPRIADDGTVTWDKVTFGSYYSDVTDCTEQNIKWRILSVDDDGQGAFLLADKALDCKPYNDVAVDKTTSSGYTYKDYSCTWETCSLRTWLNSDFYNTAFTASEKALIKKTNVVNYDYYGQGDSHTLGVNDTEDNVYLLATNELIEKYGLNDKYGEATTLSRAKLTDYARKNGAYRNYEGYCYWWLRTPGYSYNYASYVDDEGCAGNATDGDGGEEGQDFVDSVRNVLYAVRPVLHVSSLASLTNAGRVNSNGEDLTDDTPDEYSNPVTVDGVTTWECVYFGRYKQAGIYVKKPIEWRVLSVNGNDAFLLADKVLDSQPYDKYSYGGNTNNWETCFLRNWLNNDFYNAAFEATEQAVIKDTLVKKSNNTQYNISGSNDTTDKIYILSAEEATNKAYGFNDLNAGVYSDSETRQVKGTNYADFIAGGFTYASYSAYVAYFRDGGFDFSPGDWTDNFRWQLRTPGKYGNCKVATTGSIDYNGYSYSNILDSKRIAVRPAMHVDISKANLTYAGTVSANLLTQDDVDAANVDKLISTIGTVTLNSKSAIEAARTAYDALTYQGKQKVTKYDVLTAAEAKYAELEKQDKEDTANAAKVDELISAIGEVTLESKSKITEARTAYDALTSGAKNKVTKYDVLTAAETKLAELEAKKDSPATTEAPKTDATTEAPATTEETTTEVTDAQMKKTTPAVATVKEEKTKKGKVSVTIKWKTVNGANGYKVYRSTRKNKGYKCVKTIRKAATKSWKDTGVKTGKTYYYKMRAYKKSGKKTIYSKYSSTKKIRVK